VSIATDFANRALESEAWAREKLAKHVGRTVRFDVGPAHLTFGVVADGKLAPSDAAAHLVLTIEPLRLPALLADPSRWSELVTAEGDEPLAGTLAELAPTLPWFVERTLARALGPIAGQQLADAGRRLLTLPEYASERFADSVARYVGGESRLAVRAPEVHSFTAEAAELSARVDALAKRIDALDR
jgi:ubiquinone biosynthesis protein UbiJ